MFDIGFSHLVVLGIVAVLVVGPERLPGYARDAARMLRSLRDLGRTARSELHQGLGPEVATTLSRLPDPRRFVSELLAEEDAPPVRRPLPYRIEGRS